MEYNKPEIRFVAHALASIEGTNDKMDFNVADDFDGSLPGTIPAYEADE
jgi:hypothetical protein